MHGASEAQRHACVQVQSVKRPASLSGMMQALTRLVTRSLSDPFYAVIAYRNFKPVPDS